MSYSDELRLAEDSARNNYVERAITEAKGTLESDLSASRSENTQLTSKVTELTQNLSLTNSQLTATNSTLSSVRQTLTQTQASLIAEQKKYTDHMNEFHNAGYIEGWGNPVFADEFTGSAVDLTKWNVRNEDTLSYDKARIMGRNVTVSGGQLHITAKRETVSGRDFTTGYIDSINKFSQPYGRWEIRAKIPTILNQSRGIWPAFWLRNTGVGEIDIMEAWGNPFTGATNIGCSSFTCHESTNGGGNRKGYTWEHQARAKDGITRPHSANDFHTWAIEYTPTSLKGFFDGVECINMTPAAFPWLWGPAFQTPLNIRLNLQIGSPYHGHPVPPDYSDTKMPADFVIDYVRAWKLPS